MQQANTIAETSTIPPSEFSPDFTEWLLSEKIDAIRHQRRIFRATLMIALAIVLFLLKEQSQWVADILDLDAYATG